MPGARIITGLVAVAMFSVGLKISAGGGPVFVNTATYGGSNFSFEGDTARRRPVRALHAAQSTGFISSQSGGHESSHYVVSF